PPGPAASLDPPAPPTPQAPPTSPAPPAPPSPPGQPRLIPVMAALRPIDSRGGGLHGKRLGRGAGRWVGGGVVRAGGLMGRGAGGRPACGHGRTPSSAR